MKQIVDARGKRAYRYTRLEMSLGIAKYAGIVLCTIVALVLVGGYDAHLPGYSPEWNVLSSVIIILILGVVWFWAETKIQDILWYNRDQDALAEYLRQQDELDWE